MEQRPSLFRKASLDRVSSPEQLGDYIRVSNPGVWLTLAAILLLLIAGIVWCAFGTLTSTHQLVAVAQDGVVTCYAGEGQVASLQPGDAVVIGEARGLVASIASVPLQVTDQFNAYAAHLGGLAQGSWVYPVTVTVAQPDGVYLANIETENLSPFSFILN